MKKRKILRTIEIIIDVLFLSLLILSIYGFVREGNLWSNIEVHDIDRTYSLSSVASFCFTFSIGFILIYLPIIFVYLGVKIGLSYARKERIKELSNDDKTYFRDILNEYSSGELYYVFNLCVDKEALVVILLSLVNKKKIVLDKTIKIINDSNDNLDFSEVYVFDLIKGNKLNNIDYSVLSERIISLANNNKLLRKKKNSFLLFWIILLIGTFLLSGILLLIGAFLIMNFSLIGAVILMLALFIFPITLVSFIVATIIHYLINDKNTILLSNIGKELNYKLHGLKRFIHDFSILKNRNADEIILWDEYLIYSVLLHENEKVVHDVLTLI